MEACNVSGDGTVSAKGGASTAKGSGAGGGGRVAIVSGFVSSELVCASLCVLCIDVDPHPSSESVAIAIHI